MPDRSGERCSCRCPGAGRVSLLCFILCYGNSGFYEKYKDKRNICFNLKCDKENDSYDICLYVNPKIEELNVMKENIQLERKRICK